MGFTRGESNRILWIATGALILHIARHLNQLGAGLGQIDQIQVQCVRRELHLAQTTHKVVVHTSAKQSSRIDGAADINTRGGEHGELAGNMRVVRIHVIHNSDELRMKRSLDRCPLG